MLFMDSFIHQSKSIMGKKILYIDMDNVLVDFKSGIDCLTDECKMQYEGRLDEVPGIFTLMQPVKGAVESFNELAEHFDIYILSTSPWNNPTAASDKFAWVRKFLEPKAHKRLILTHYKNLNKGDYLVDDRTKNGASEFEGEHIHFGTSEFPDWKAVRKYLIDHAE